MTDDDLIALVSSHAVAILEYDDAFPDVGWGKSISTAIEEANEMVFREAARWNSLEALRLHPMPEHITTAAYKAVEKLRRKR